MADTEVSSVVSDFIGFLNASPTAFHAVDDAKTRLQKVGYEQVVEREDWKLEAGKRYFLTRNHSTIVAFAIGKKYVAGNGFHIVSAHTDSPCLKLKPVSEVKKAGYLEVVAGRVMIREEKGGSVSYSHRLVRIEEPIMCVPTLAIHLDRSTHKVIFYRVLLHAIFLILVIHHFHILTSFIIVDLCQPYYNSLKLYSSEIEHHFFCISAGLIIAFLCSLFNLFNRFSQVELNKEFAENGLVEKTTNKSRHHAFLLQMIANKLGCQPDQICDFELQACDTQPSVVAGAAKEFIFSGRLDNRDPENESGVRMVALFDHEEVGSNSAQGAGSPAMLDALSRITYSFTSDSKMLTKAIQRSFLVSADMAHALHPNYMVFTSFIFREIAVKHNLPIQDFVVRNDMPCGSTIGPILAGGVGIRTVDIGAPQLSMHGIREMCAVDDVKHSNEHFKAFFHEFSQLDTKISVDT
ncbi:hypothetical protein ES288_D03G134300v1 [Gossypium darwinii]|uniref:Aspartyl aminopeptidase n=1 Tax=Gossypium darwinii TaxID=34276 RepID=A0A5D2D6J7_GOSDA|nr:hypothetical protein ES288_D03G134300v1 [Gossypium darwinii]